MKATPNKHLWLVKTGDRILGPFSADEVSAKIRTREIVVIDEVAAPLTRWRYVRDEPAFRVVVDEIRKSMANLREDTEIQGYTESGASTESAVPTQSGPESSNSGAIDAEFTDHDDHTYVQASSRRDRRTPPPNHSRETDSFGEMNRSSDSPQYGLPAEPKKPPVQVGVWIGAVLIVAGVAYALFSSQSEKQNPNAEPTPAAGLLAPSPLVQAEQAWKRGDFDRALRFYSDAIAADPKRPEAISRLAPLLIQANGQIVEAKRILSESQSKNKNVNVHDSEIALGLAALAEDDLGEADTHFRAALAVSPGSSIATFNLGITAFLSKSYEKAERLFSTAAESGAEPAAALMLARSVIAFEKPKSASYKAADLALDTLLKHSFDYRQEAMLLKAYIAAQSGNKKSAIPFIKSTLEIDPELTANHWHDPRLVIEPLRWKSLVSLCRKIQDETHAQSARALYAFCLGKAGDLDDATKTLNQALSLSPQDPLLESVSAYVLIASGREDSARASLKIAFKSEAPVLASFIRTRLCEHAGDTACADIGWQALSTQPMPSPAAFVGLSRIALAKKQIAKANDFDRKALELSPNYIPAMRLRDEVSKP